MARILAVWAQLRLCLWDKASILTHRGAEYLEKRSEDFKEYARSARVNLTYYRGTYRNLGP